MFPLLAQRTLLSSATVCMMMCGTLAVAQSETSTETPATPVIRVYRHSAWGETPPKGVEADGLRRNLAVDDSVTFKELTITVTEMTPAVTEGESAGSARDQATLSLSAGEASESQTVNEGDAFNWQDYHVSVVAIYATKGDLGFGSTVIEVATIDSLPPEVANSTTANGPEYRLRVKHTIDRLTLHHSATPHNPGDDLGKKLRNMQAWGESDRNWWDIPYHFIIDLDGTVYEARDYHYAGDTNTRYDTSGHFLINCYGNYDNQEPNEAQLATIANLMAWAAVEFGIDPIKIYGHKDLASTGCPGENLHKLIRDGSLQARVEAIVMNGQPTIEWRDSIEK